MSPIILDARGMRCPWPALRLARAVREAPGGAVVVLIADDPKAEAEIARLADGNGWSCAVERDQSACRFTVRA